MLPVEWKRAAHADLWAIGCEIIEGEGSRVRFIRDDIIGYFHRPHPKKEAAPYQIRDAKTFLIKLGVES